jgi:hypothetical protein
VICPGNDEKMLWTTAGFVIFISHFHGDKPIVRAVYQQHRQATPGKRLGSGTAGKASLISFFAKPVGNRPTKGIGKMEIVFYHMAANILRACKATISDETSYRSGKRKLCTHQHGGGSHGYPGKI